MNVLAVGAVDSIIKQLTVKYTYFSLFFLQLTKHLVSILISSSRNGIDNYVWTRFCTNMRFGMIWSIVITIYSIYSINVTSFPSTIQFNPYGVVSCGVSFHWNLEITVWINKNYKIIKFWWKLTLPLNKWMAEHKNDFSRYRFFFREWKRNLWLKWNVIMERTL